MGCGQPKGLRFQRVWGCTRPEEEIVLPTSFRNVSNDSCLGFGVWGLQSPPPLRVEGLESWCPVDKVLGVGRAPHPLPKSITYPKVNTACVSQHRFPKSTCGTASICPFIPGAAARDTPFPHKKRNTSKRFEEFNLQARARSWPWLSGKFV